MSNDCLQTLIKNNHQNSKTFCHPKIANFKPWSHTWCKKAMANFDGHKSYIQGSMVPVIYVWPRMFEMRVKLYILQNICTQITQSFSSKLISWPPKNLIRNYSLNLLTHVLTRYGSIRDFSNRHPLCLPTKSISKPVVVWTFHLNMSACMKRNS